MNHGGEPGQLGENGHTSPRGITRGWRFHCGGNCVKVFDLKTKLEAQTAVTGVASRALESRRSRGQSLMPKQTTIQPKVADQSYQTFKAIATTTRCGGKNNGRTYYGSVAGAR